jgi:cellulose synthase/poly-beta-1,6-N-acetylglucosamine synthase-like glycosyltransferase
MTALKWIFWGGLAWLIYIYIGYPMFLALLRRLRPRVVQRGEDLPRVTIVTAAFNEEAHIGQTIANKLALDYPRELLEIIVVSDGSVDRTDEIVSSYSSQGVKLIRQEPRQGKTAGLNKALAVAQGDVVVFSDANSLYAPDGLRKLVRAFADPSVGYVTGKMVYVSPDGSLVGDGCTAYMRYENLLRELESVVGSVVGVDGGIDAVRRKLYQPMRADQLPDFVLPLSVVRQGYRVVYEEQALLQEHALSAAADEFRMRVRVSLRAFWALWDLRSLLSPFRFGLFSWQLWSHKVLRYLAFVPMIAVLLSNIALLNAGPIYQIALVGQVLIYGLAIAGSVLGSLDNAPRVLVWPNYFVLLNVASGVAFWRFINGQKQVLWKPRTG